VSAWIVEDEHITVLLNAIRQFWASQALVISEWELDLQRIGQMLWEENHRSVNHRYDEDTPTPRYQLRWIEGELHPVAVLKAIGCYEYQSCERPDWQASDACKLCQLLTRAILAHHPELGTPVPSRYSPGGTEPAYRHHPAYQAAPWGYSQAEQALAAAYAGPPGAEVPAATDRGPR